ncbi:MAG: CoA transferase [Vicinamibacterales bacterium]|nr:CoA transferase [Vicinamibacterales bacterium]
MSRSTGPLSGIRVADFFWLIAGPATSRILADYGADVIKIESAARVDQIRDGGVWPPPDRLTATSRNSVFNDCNTNKRSITLDLNHPEAIEIAKQLVACCDIVTNNFKGDRMERWGLGYEELRRIKPDVIMLTMPVMGTTGPYLSYGANGNGVIAAGGINFGMGFPERPPTGMGPLYSDFATPYVAASALMSALHHRERTGEGTFIDLAQFESTVGLLGPQILEYTANGSLPERRGNRSADWAPHGAYPCAGEDRWIAIAVTSDEEWVACCEAMGQHDVSADKRYATNRARLDHAAELDRLVESWTSDWDAWDLTHHLQQSGVAAGVVEDLEDMLTRDPHLRERHFEDIPGHNDGLQYITHRQPARLDGQDVPLRRPPDMGEHNQEVFEELLGISGQQYAELLADGVVY